MTKTQQENINKIVLEAIDECKVQKLFLNRRDCKQLRRCQAWVYEDDNYAVLRSYNTIIAFIDKRTNRFFDFLRYVYGYTATRAQHISKFRSDYRSLIKEAYTYR